MPKTRPSPLTALSYFYVQSHAHLQTMNETFAKFRKDENKIIGGVALTKGIWQCIWDVKNDYVYKKEKV